jgi:hypothetical protein
MATDRQDISTRSRRDRRRRWAMMAEGTAMRAAVGSKSGGQFTRLLDALI